MLEREINQLKLIEFFHKCSVFMKNSMNMNLSLSIFSCCSVRSLVIFWDTGCIDFYHLLRLNSPKRPLLPPICLSKASPRKGTKYFLSSQYSRSGCSHLNLPYLQFCLKCFIWFGFGTNVFCWLFLSYTTLTLLPQPPVPTFLRKLLPWNACAPHLTQVSSLQQREHSKVLDPYIHARAIACASS